MKTRQSTLSLSVNARCLGNVYDCDRPMQILMRNESQTEKCLKFLSVPELSLMESNIVNEQRINIYFLTKLLPPFFSLKNYISNSCLLQKN